jgi:ABC-type antimicrobial peptide transport system permease subunit
MSLFGLRLRGLLYHWRGNLAVLLGVAVGTSVLTGALLVGDALRGSLRDLTLRRLGWVDQALVAPKFFRVTVADGLPAERIAPALLLQATADRPGGSVRRVTLLGVDERFGVPVKDGVVLGSALAGELKVKAGDAVTFRVQKAADVPRESLLGKRDDAFTALSFRVADVLDEDAFGSRFALQPTPEAPRNAFVPLAELQEALAQPGRANALFVGGLGAGLTEAIRARLDLSDWGLRLTTPTERADALFNRYDLDSNGVLTPFEWYKGTAPARRPWYKGGGMARRPLANFATSIAWGILDPQRKGTTLPRRPITRAQFRDYFVTHHGYLSLESGQLILEPEVGKAALSAAEEAGLRAAPTLVYLCKIQARRWWQAPSRPRVAGIVAALDPTLRPPLGPFQPTRPEAKGALADDEIVLADWKDEPSLPPLTPGDPVTLTFKPPEHRPGAFPDRTATFRFAGTLPLTGAADDPDLTPAFPGITDKDDARQWKLPFEDKNDPAWLTDTVRREYGDPLFWGEYRTTPKAYITLKAGQKLWSSRFGDLTSIRLALKSGSDLGAAKKRFSEALLKRLDPEKGGFVLLAVKDDALKASAGGTDFAQLFLGFSFFLIAAALLLVVLLFRLNLDRRASEVGLLLAAGWRRAAVRRLLLGEGAVLAAVGVAVGLLGALAYTALLVEFLAAFWPGGALRSFLRPHFENAGLSLTIGAAASFLAAVGSVAWALRGQARREPVALLRGQTEESALAPARPRWSWWVAAVALVLAPAALASAAFVPGHEAQAGAFFSGGALLLTAALAALSGWLRGARHRPVETGAGAVAKLGVRNAARNPGRSLLTAGLLASAAFLLVAVEAFRRHAGGETGLTAPDGGYALLAESDLPVFDDLDGDKGRAAVVAKLPAEERSAALALLRETRVVAFRVRDGDDASCLNLYQPRRPRVLGVPAALIDRGGFAFAATREKSANPWLRLRGTDGDEVPAFGEKNSVEWMLKKGLGQTVTVPDGAGRERQLRLAGLLQDSVFQSGLLVSEENFLKLYPDTEGYRFFLIQPPEGHEEDVKKLLEAGLADRGLEVTPTAQRLQAYLDVENTYLSTFQALGGLGLLLGALGLAVVLLRGVWERRSELALLRALGYRRAALAWLVLAENGFLLLVGLGAGALAALAAVAPHLLTSGASVPWPGLAGLFGLVLLVGAAAGALAVRSVLRAPLVQALRRE